MPAASDPTDDQGNDPAPDAEFPADPGWFQAVVEQINDMVLAVDGDGRLLYGNPAVQDWLGFDPTEELGASVTDYIHLDDHARAIGSIAFDAATDEPTTPAPIRRVRRDGKVLAFDFMANPKLRHPTIQAQVFRARSPQSARRRRGTRGHGHRCAPGRHAGANRRTDAPTVLAGRMRRLFPG